jgi:hypothetical protein
MVLYKGFRIRAYEDWSGLWLAEAKKPLGTEAKKAAGIEASKIVEIARKGRAEEVAPW